MEQIKIKGFLGEPDLKISVEDKDINFEILGFGCTASPSEVNKLISFLCDHMKAIGEPVDALKTTLTLDKVSKMIDNCSRETWIAASGNEQGWKQWWHKRNQLKVNRTIEL